MTTDGPWADAGGAELDLHFQDLAGLVERMDRTRSLDDAARLLIAFAVQHLGADVAGISVRSDQGPIQRIAASSQVLTELDAAEAAATGPGSAVVTDGAVVVVPDTRRDQQWPAWSSTAAALELGSACLTGMPPLRGQPVVLELFSSSPGAFGDGHTVLVRSVAKHGGLGLRHVDRRANLEDALRTRALIGQAQGILMERYGLSADQAMSFLRRTSQHSQVKVRDIAERLIAWFEPGSPAAP